MLGQSRFFLNVAMCFGIGFFAFLWVKAGAPIPTVTVRAMKANPAIPTFEQSVEQSRNRARVEQQTSQSDGDPERDALRLAAMQAATAYKLSPCDQTMKENLVKALTAYTKAWAEKSGCTPLPCGGMARVDLAAAMFGTPADLRVREAATRAFAEGGITADDFPKMVRTHLLMVTGGRGSPESACAAPRPRRRS